METKQIAIVGGGQAGVQLVESLCSGGFEGGTTLIGDEAHRPYARTPLFTESWYQTSMSRC